MPRIAEQAGPVIGGVDTHADVHVAAVVDQVGRVLGTQAFPASADGYQATLAWMSALGELAKVGVEGTGSYGAGLARYLAACGIEVVEVIRPNRQARRQRGKSDAADSVAAALAALNGEASGVPKSHDGAAESIRALRVARAGAVKARTQAGNQLRELSPASAVAKGQPDNQIDMRASSREHGPVSWDEAFADRYEEWSADLTADIAFYVDLAREADGPLVELAVGNGRVAIPVAQATGQPVIGIDTSQAMLAQAHASAAGAGVVLDLREGDMRDLALDEPAALIYCPFRALLHLPGWADRRHTFERVGASLRPGGRFAWNAFAFDHQIAARLDGEHQQEPVPHTNRYAVGDNRIDIILDTGAKSSLWWATKNEWLGLIDAAGFELEALYGGFARQPFTDASREYVFIARRPVPSSTPGHRQHPQAAP